MDGEESEQLFLLEFLVDSVRIKGSAGYSPPQIDSIPSQLTTIFQFLKFPPLEIREKDSPNKGDSAPTFKIGKSCLFAIPSKRLVDFSKLFNLNVSVARRFPPGVLPEKTILGETTVDISSDFAYVVTEVLTNPHAIPKSKSIRETYNLRNENNYIGSIVLYLRISCFGKLIVNEFQLNTENSVMFQQEQGNKEEGRANEREFPPYKVGSCDDIFEGHRIGVKKSSSESSAPSRFYADDDFTEMGAKMDGRWVTIRVPKDQLRSHGGDYCQLDGGSVAMAGYEGAGGMDGVIGNAGKQRYAKGGRYEAGQRNHLALMAGGGRAMGAGEAMSLPPSRESMRTGAASGMAYMRGRPTSTPLGLHPDMPTPSSAAEHKAPKAKAKSSKAKPGKSERKADKKGKRKAVP